MSDMESNQKELRRIHRLLSQIKEMAEHSSMTGSLKGGSAEAAKQYNAIVGRLEQIGEVPKDFFGTLSISNETPFDTIGVAAGQVAAYIEDGIQEEKSSEKGGEDYSNSPQFHVNINGPVGNLADLEQLRSLGDIIRNNMPEWMRDKMPKTEEMPAPSQPEAPAESSFASAPPTPPHAPTVTLTAITDAPHIAEFVPDIHNRERAS